MSTDAHTDPRRELYWDFKKQLKNNQNVFFDKDVLLDVYSFADDEGDTYTMLEVVSIANQLYPDDDDLNLRRALTFETFGFHDQAVSIAEGVRSESPFAALVKLRLSGSNVNTVKKKLHQIVCSATSLDEDDIIQITDIVRDSNITTWFLENLDTVKEKAEYLPTLFYELAMNCCDEADYVTAMNMAEELVDAEPMKAEFWEIYAEIAYHLLDLEKALSGAEYALAINSNSKRGALYKGCSLALMRRFEQAIEPLEQIYLDPEITTPVVVELLASCYADNPKKQISLFTSFLDNSTTLSRDTITWLARVSPQAAQPYIDKFLETLVGMYDDEYIAEWAGLLCSVGRTALAAYMLAKYDELNPDYGTFEYYDKLFECLYVAGMYKDVISLYKKKKDDDVFSPAMHVAYVLSVLRLDGVGEALKAIRKSKKMFRDAYLLERADMFIADSKMRVAFFDQQIGLIESALGAAVKQNAPIDIDRIDPFIGG
ncbi:MAG: hypothetical protein J1E84_01620 [Muribaculaceae bacterium]|nr:hypothetical protein [Muribaculaceae bacterium]